MCLCVLCATQVLVVPFRCGADMGAGDLGRKDLHGSMTVVHLSGFILRKGWIVSSMVDEIYRYININYRN